MTYRRHPGLRPPSAGPHVCCVCMHSRAGTVLNVRQESRKCGRRETKPRNRLVCNVCADLLETARKGRAA